jgi:hypothetical protein
MTERPDKNSDYAEKGLAELLAKVESEKEITVDGVAYALWVHLTHALVHWGWKPEELARDAEWHAKNEEGS